MENLFNKRNDKCDENMNIKNKNENKNHLNMIYEIRKIIYSKI